MPTADTVLDATLNPDFSQIESDTAQIGANERFALFFPEKRPFFLEGVELLSTPIRAVHTRTITSPRWGMRGTGTVGGAAYTALVAEDTIAGQLLLSQSLAPNRPDLASEWDGRRLSGHGAAAWWYHSTETIHWFAQYRDFADGFRADNGFVPQVGYRRALGQIDYTFRPEGLTAAGALEREDRQLFAKVSYAFQR
jgi:hypothetical protein